MSIEPSLRVTIARLVFLRLPKPNLVRRVLPWRLRVLTESTFTPKTRSTAILISVLLARGSTMKVYLPRPAARRTSRTPQGPAECRGGPCSTCSLGVLLVIRSLCGLHGRGSLYGLRSLCGLHGRGSFYRLRSLGCVNLDNVQSLADACLLGLALGGAGQEGA